MKLLILIVGLLVGLSSNAQIHVDAYIDFETSTSGTIVTPTIVSNSVKAGQSAFTGYETLVSLSSSPLTFMAITNIEGPQMWGSVSIGGSTVQPSLGTRCLYTEPSEFESALWSFASQTHIVVGFMCRPGFGGSGDFNFYDAVTLQGGADFSVMNVHMDGNNSSDSQRVFSHNQNGVSASGINLFGMMNDGYWYWCTMEYNGGALTQIAIYDATNHVQVGSTVSLACNNSGMTQLKLGMNHSPNNVGVPAFWYYDNVIVAMGDNAVFPLIPTNVTDCLIADHRTDWTTAGVRGGVPTVSTIYTNFYSTNYYAQIQTGINNCPSNQVVKLNGGPYTLTNFLDVLQGVVLRGDGPTNTQLYYTGGGFEALRIRGSATINPPPNCVSWTNGFASGSTNLFFSSVPNLVVGQAVILTENPDQNIVQPTGNNGVADYSGMIQTNSLVYQQIVVVTAITTNMVTVFPPLYATNWLSSLSPIAFWLGSNTSIHRAGIENLCIDTVNGTPSFNILVQDAVDCWLKNVESRNAGLAHVEFFESTCCEQRECYEHLMQSYGTSAYGTYLLCSSGIKVEDNIFYEVAGPIRYATASGNIFGYNFIGWVRYDADPTFLNQAIKSHGGHPYMNLIEGNCLGYPTNGSMIFWDFTHGSSSHNTAFRNLSPGYVTNSTDDTFAIGAMVSNRWENVIDNVLGVSNIHTNYSQPQSGTATRSIYALGFTNTAYTASGYDPLVASTMLIHGNQDTFTSTNNGIVWASGYSQSFSNSYYLSSAPAWWDGSRWPGIGGDLSLTNFTPNPAMTRFTAMSKRLSLPSMSLSGATLQMSGATMQISQ